MSSLYAVLRIMKTTTMARCGASHEANGNWNATNVSDALLLLIYLTIALAVAQDMSAPVSMAQIVPFVLFCSSVVFGYTGMCIVDSLLQAPSDPRAVPIVRHENSAEALEKARTFVSRLNLTEKIDMITGIQGVDAGGCIGNIKAIPRLNFSGICMQDGPQAMNRADLVSVFASGVLVGATWDVDLMFERGKAMGEEFRGKGAHVQLG